MYSLTTLARKYIHYLITAYNGKGHGVHSPFVFEFISKVLNDTACIASAPSIESVRKSLQQNKQYIEVQDFGAGSSVIPTRRRMIGAIAATSLKKPKYARLLHQIAKYYHCKNMIELGTSFGITSAYLATANSAGQLHTFEGAPAIANIAQHNFQSLHISNIHLHEGDFRDTLPAFLAGGPLIDLAFIDGHHKKDPTLQYFEAMLAHAHDNTLFIFDDIHWSTEMEAAWEQIKQHRQVTLTIDLFFIGIVLVKKEFKVKQHFTIRF